MSDKIEVEVGSSLVLKNNTLVTFTGFDGFSRPTLECTHNKKLVILVIVDNVIHATCGVECEPSYPISSSMQLKEYDHDFMSGKFIKKKEIK